MDLNQKRILKALEFISNNFISQVDALKIKEKSGLRVYSTEVPSDVENFLLKEKYISFKKEDLQTEMFYITKSGEDYKNQIKKLKFEFLGSVSIKLNIIFTLINTI